MRTPIHEFVRDYARRNALRLHMPGHKGVPLLGAEPLDITEISGADSLYEADGIIRQSQDNASALFDCPTYYATEGSSQCIRAMLYLAGLYAGEKERRPLVLAGRNAHKTFLSGAALLDLQVEWLNPGKGYLSCDLTPGELEARLSGTGELPVAVYLTSPDYLGHMQDIGALARVCHRHDVLLLVDNAHGAYLKFLPESLHPMDLGADLCCDSAHKTLPVLTGGAYLHLSRGMQKILGHRVTQAMELFGSTSPSYLILQSLDLANGCLQGWREKLWAFLPAAEELKIRLKQGGYTLVGDEPMKVTLATKPFGYRGTELGALLLEQDVVCEFADPDYLVMMLTPELGRENLARLERLLMAVPPKPPIPEYPPELPPVTPALSIRQAVMSPGRRVPVEESLGRILAAANVGCPPAVPIVVCGERITPRALECFRYYGITHCLVTEDSEKT